MDTKNKSALEMLINNGRITLWIVLLIITIFALTGKISGDTALQAIAAWAVLALGNELRNRRGTKST
jgi:hypothetical protein